MQGYSHLTPSELLFVKKLLQIMVMYCNSEGVEYEYHRVKLGDRVKFGVY